MSQYATTVVLKLLTGQEIIGRFSHKQDGYWILDDVREIIPIQVDTRIKLSLAPFILAMMGENGRIQIPDTAVMAKPDEVAQRLEKDYLSSVSRIQIAGAGDIK